MRLYAESSAVLAWLLGEPQGDDVRRLLAGAEEVLTSVLTLMLAALGVLIVRIVIGALFIGHGLQKLAGWFGGRGLAGTEGLAEVCLTGGGRCPQ